MSRVPVKGKFNITAYFGQSGKHWANGHKGIDIVNENRVIFAPCKGRVRVVAYDEEGWGQYISIGDEKGRRHILCHLVRDGVRVRAGQDVTQETIVGVMGSTGNSTGVHLHYELHDSAGRVIDVTKYIGCPNKIGTYSSMNYQDIEKSNTKQSEKEKTTMAQAVYDSVQEAPSYARGTLQKLIDKKYLTGTGGGKLNLSEDMIRILVILDRAGNFN